MTVREYLAQLEALVADKPPPTPQERATLHLLLYGSVVTDENGAIIEGVDPPMAAG